MNKGQRTKWLCEEMWNEGMIASGVRWAQWKLHAGRLVRYVGGKYRSEPSTDYVKEKSRVIHTVEKEND